MITNIALLLSFDGISLLHRAENGWVRIGTADVADPDLATLMVQLRDAALGLVADGLRCKIIIPTEQIKYLAIDTTQTGPDDIDRALDGTTPYALTDLVVDYERSGGRTHIAAVARDTLQEAEAFALGYGFNPVCFAAIPEPFTFAGEIFFGPTAMMPEVLGPHGTVSRDAQAVYILDDPTEAVDYRATAPSPVDAFADADEDPTMIADMLPPDPDAALGDLFASRAAQQATAPAKGVATSTKTPVWIDRIISEYHVPPAEHPIVLAHPVMAGTKPANLGSVDLIIPEYHPNQPMATIPPHPVVRVPVAPIAPLRMARTPAAPPTRRRTVAVALTVAAMIAAAAGIFWLASVNDSSRVLPSQISAETAPPETVSATERSTPVSTAMPSPVTAAGDGIARDAPNLSSDPPDDVPAMVLDTGPRTPPAAPLQDVAILTAPVAPHPTWGSPGVFARPVTPEPAALAAPATADTAMAPVAGPPPPPAPDLTPSTNRRTLGRVLSPDAAARIYAATGVWQRAPRFASVPRSTTAQGIARPDPRPAPGRVARPASTSLTTDSTDQLFAAPANPPPPGANFPIGDDGFVQATPDGTLTPEGLLVIAGVPDIPVRTRPELSADDLARMEALAPAPEGIAITPGTPAVQPPLRPADITPPEDESDDTLTPAQEAGNAGSAQRLETDPALASVRPRIRPDGIAPPAPPAGSPGTPDITSVTAGLDAEPDDGQFADASKQAIVTSPRPTLRPRNFDRVVASARARTPAQPDNSASDDEPSFEMTLPQTTQPVPGGVARAATEDNVISLREMTLIGIYGRSSARRALVRLSNGRYQRVEVGSTLDGGQVTAIGETALNYVKRGRTYALELPAG